MKLETNAFYDGGRLPVRFTADGEGFSPPLRWSGTPPGTRSYALVCSDPDAPSGTFYHWAVYDIPAAEERLLERYPRAARGAPWQAINDFGRAGYDGPAPPARHGTHHYHFRLYALDVDHLGLTSGKTGAEVEQAARVHAIAEAELVGTYSR